jgi:negative modulator of initiation of replication
MRTIEIEDDVYEHLRQQQTTFSGETASDVLRRLLRLNSPMSGDPGTESSGRSVPPKGVQQLRDDLLREEKQKALWEFVKGPQFMSERNAVGRFLALLAFLYRQDPVKFAVLERIDGRSRKYFATSESELEQSGTSVHPKNVPGSGYWVVTNNSTNAKRDLILQAMKLLGYDGGLSAFAATHLV